MGIKVYKPITNGRRDMTTLTNREITTSTPEKSLPDKSTKSHIDKSNTCFDIISTIRNRNNKKHII